MRSVLLLRLERLATSVHFGHLRVIVELGDWVVIDFLGDLRVISYTNLLRINPRVLDRKHRYTMLIQIKYGSKKRNWYYLLQSSNNKHLKLIFPGTIENITCNMQSQSKFALDLIKNYANESVDSECDPSNRKIEQFDRVENFSLMPLNVQVFSNLERTTRISRSNNSSSCIDEVINFLSP
jgi:hypothetical protein